MSPSFDEESRQLLRRIVEDLAWRQLASMNILGHCLKFVVELDTKLRVASELDLSLRLFEDVRSLYGELGWTDIESAVRERLDQIPYPESRLEFGVAYYVTGLAERVAMKSYVDSSHPRFAAIAMSYVDAAARRPEPSRFLEFCAEPTNRPQAQQFLNLWLTVSFRSLDGGSARNDERIVRLGLRTRTSAEMRAELVRAVGPFLERCGLSLPGPERLGLEATP